MGTELDVARSQELEAVLAAQDAELAAAPFNVPIIKIGQQLTEEVKAGDAEAGEFIYTGTDTVLGDRIEFIVASYNQGWFASSDDRAYAWQGDTFPPHWEPYVGESYIGTPIREHPDAEPTYAKRVNNKEIEWGHGPPIGITHNFTGFVILPAEEGDEDGETDYLPARLSLQRTQVPSVKKWATLKRLAGRKSRAWWDKKYILTTTPKTFGRHSAHILVPNLGDDTNAEERSMAADLAIEVHRGNVVTNEEAHTEATSPAPVAEPDAQGGAAI